jgi:hypothetical protein
LEKRAWMNYARRCVRRAISEINMKMKRSNWICDTK